MAHNKNHSYKGAIKKQIGTIFVALLIIIGGGLQLYPVNTPYKAGVFAILVILVGIGTFFYVRKFGFQQLCTNCKTNIFPFIDLGKQISEDVKYCPTCGQKVKI